MTFRQVLLLPISPVLTRQIKKFVNIVLCDMIASSRCLTSLRGEVEGISIPTIYLSHLQSLSCGSPPGNLTSLRLRAKICSTLFLVWQTCPFCQPVLEKTWCHGPVYSLPIPSGRLCTLPASIPSKDSSQ